MNIDFENSELMFKLTKYFGEMEDGRTFAIIVRSTDSSDSVEDVETDDEFTFFFFIFHNIYLINNLWD